MANEMMDKPYGPYAGMYKKFFELKDHYKGYDFGKAPRVKNPPPHMTFPRPLKWWSLDRGRRLRDIRHVRDGYLMDIIKLGQLAPADNVPMDVCDKIRRRAGNLTKGPEGEKVFQGSGEKWQRRPGDRRAA